MGKYLPDLVWEWTFWRDFINKQEKYKPPRQKDKAKYITQCYFVYNDTH